MDQTKPGYSANKSAHLKRPRRIEGQVRGLQRMVESDTYCIDVLTRTALPRRPQGVRAAVLSGVRLAVLGCVRGGLGVVCRALGR